MSEENYKIAIKMPRPLFDRLKRRAKRKKQSFSEVAADCLACGLLDIEESEAMEEAPNEQLRQLEDSQPGR
jgi:hypothetical protein